MNLQNLRYILEIVNQGSISAAARSLFISQPYLSKILMEVEREYHITIFSREKNNLVLTRQGMAFIEKIRTILSTMDRYEKELHHMDETLHMSFAACTAAYPTAVYLNFIEAHKDQHLRIHFKECDNNAVIHDVYKKDVEFGIIILNHEEMNAARSQIMNMRLKCQKLFEMELYLITRIGHPLSRLNRMIEIEDIYPYDFVLYPQLHPLENTSIKMAQYMYYMEGIDWKRIRHITYIQSRAQYYDMIQRSDAITFGFQPYKNQETSGNIVSLRLSPDFVKALNRDTTSALYVIYPEDHEFTPLSTDFLSYLNEFSW